jgi:hypothetical protein
MRGSVKSWVIVGTLVLALLFGGAYAFTPLRGGAVPGMMSGGMIGPGMMGQSPGMGSGMMGGCPMGSSMMGWYPGFVARDMEQAAQAAQRYLAAFWRDPDLAIKEVMEFSNQFYVQIKEQSTELGAMELIVEKFNGLVHPEPGPNMMWNLKYGHMGRGMGMMGWWQGWQAPTAQMPIGPEQAAQLAQQYLNTYMPGAVVTEEITPFYGYYTLDLERGGQIFGMLSVNGYTGQVWYHNWHGQFLGMMELEEH